MGVKKKEHRKKVAKRNERIRGEVQAIEDLKYKIYNEAKERYNQTTGQTKQTIWNITT